MPSASTTDSVARALVGRFWERARGDVLLWVLAAAALLFALAEPERVPQFARLIDWPTIAALAGLLLLTQAIEMSGALDALAQRLLGWFSTERRAGLWLVLVAALLSMVVTNDVALFAVVPLTLSLATHAKLPVARLVTFEALAVNAGSCLTPIGNPQNLFLWQSSGASVGQFLAALAPTSGIALAFVLILTALSFPGRTLAIAPRSRPPVERSLLALGAGLYLPFLVLCDLRFANYAAPALIVLTAFARRDVLVRVDWALLLVFILMFIDLRLAAQLPLIRSGLDHAHLGDPRRVWATAVASSQVISNVPAAILMAEYSSDWRAIGSGVSVGGFGLAIGSLANLIALRFVPGKRIWWVFHAYSVPFLLTVAAAVFFFAPLSQ